MIRPTPPPPPKDEAFVPPPSSAVVAPSTNTIIAPTPATEGGLPSAPTSTMQDVPVGPLVGAQGIAPEPAEELEEDEIEIDLADEFTDFLLSPHYKQSIESVQKEFGLSNEDLIFLTDLDRLVMSGKMDLSAYPSALKDELKNVAEEQRKKLFAQLLAERFLPLGDLLKPSAIDVAKSEGLTLPIVPHYRVYTKPLSYSAAAGEMAAMAGFSIMGGPVRERLRELIMSKVKGVRTDLQVREALTRGLDFGGVGLDPKMADKAVAAMNDILGRAKVISEDEYANWLADEAQKKSSVLSPQSSVPSQGTVEDEEIERMKASMPRPVVDATSELAKSVAATLGRLSYQPTDEYLARRLQSIVSSRLRDVRSAIEFRQMLARPVKVGGLGLEPAQADEVASQVEQSYKEFHDAIEAEEKRKIGQQLEDQKRKIEERRGRESEEHAKWFEEKIRSRKAGGTEKERGEEAMRKLMGAPQAKTPMEAKEARVEAAKFGPLVPADAAKPAGVKVSPPTVEIAKAAAAAKPTLDAVKYAGPQLMGLIGELKSVTAAEFRRVAKDPQKAAQKILQKIETLGQESFEKRVEGIRAFQGSPLQAAYMALVAESFKTAKPVVTLAEEKRTAGQDTLGPDEIAAVMKINSALHF